MLYACLHCNCYFILFYLPLNNSGYAETLVSVRASKLGICCCFMGTGRCHGTSGPETKDFNTFVQQLACDLWLIGFSCSLRSPGNDTGKSRWKLSTLRLYVTVGETLKLEYLRIL